jgi:nucleotidyltransferase substrate binding protein (TIGR01987 family)
MNADKTRALENFGRALGKLELFLATPIVDERDKAGIIQAFEYCFELCWKSIQKMVVEHNKTVGSPKQAFQAAFELGWIREREQGFWVEMANDRNLTSHTYKETLAEEVLGRIQAAHVLHLRGLLETLKKAIGA